MGELSFLRVTNDSSCQLRKRDLPCLLVVHGKVVEQHMPLGQALLFLVQHDQKLHDDTLGVRSPPVFVIQTQVKLEQQDKFFHSEMPVIEFQSNPVVQNLV